MYIFKEFCISSKITSEFHLYKSHISPESADRHFVDSL